MKLRILNETGHTELEVNASEIIEQINDHPTHWVFVDGEMVSRETISSVNWDGVELVDLTPAIVGGALQIESVFMPYSGEKRGGGVSLVETPFSLNSISEKKWRL